MERDFDFLIIGGGIVGISIGIALLQSNRNFRVVVVEKELSLGAHASGRNSGVLHAGFYYTSESLKSKFCIEGNLALKEVVKKHKLPILRTGKVVIARNEEEESHLLALFEKGKANGVDLQLIDPNEMDSYEPLAQTKFPFLWSPNTAVVDQMSILESLKKDFYSLGGVFSFDANVRLVVKDSHVSLLGTNHRARIIINSGGVGSLELAQSIGVANNLRLIPIRGSYKATNKKNLPLRTLVYPIPNPINPFLGVHFTPNLKGEIKLGPTAFPVLGNEQYALKDWPNLSELTRNLGSILTFGIKRTKQSLAILRKEIPYLYLGNIIREARQLVPATPGLSYWKDIRPGIRAQLFDISTGEFINDFSLKISFNSLHLLNIVSPGFTSAIPLARYSASEAIRLFNTIV